LKLTHNSIYYTTHPNNGLIILDRIKNTRLSIDSVVYDGNMFVRFKKPTPKAKFINRTGAQEILDFLYQVMGQDMKDADPSKKILLHLLFDAHCNLEKEVTNNKRDYNAQGEF
jgi:hypothetical protein